MRAIDPARPLFSAEEGGLAKSKRRYSASPKLQLKIILRIVATNVGNDRTCHVQVIWDIAAFHVICKEVANQSSEILMPRIGKQRARIGKHSDENAYQALIVEGVNLLRHAVPLVEKPPSRTVLNFAANALSLKISNYRGKHGIVGGVQII